MRQVPTGYEIRKSQTTNDLKACVGIKTPDEEKFHMALVAHLKLVLKPQVEWYHVPNGGKRSAREGAKFKKLGTKAGVPDLQFHYLGKTYFLELKTDKGRLSPEQKLFIERLRAQGFSTAIARSVDEAMSHLSAWGLIRISASIRIAA